MHFPSPMLFEVALILAGNRRVIEDRLFFRFAPRRKELVFRCDFVPWRETETLGDCLTFCDFARNTATSKLTLRAAIKSSHSIGNVSKLDSLNAYPTNLFTASLW
jgi:hypothetical protein